MHKISHIFCIAVISFFVYLCYCLFSLAEVSEFEQYLPILLGILQTDESDVCVMQVLSKVTFTAWCTYNYVEMYMYRISILTGVQVSSG